jgi:hypothetical protein
MDRDDTPAHESHWERWTDDSGPFYRSCAVPPVDPVTEPEGAGTERPRVQFTTGVTRLLLRNLPTVLLVVLAVYVPSVLYNNADRLGLTLPEPGLGTVALFVPGLVVGGIWLYLLYRLSADSVGGSSIHRSLLFFGTALPLVVGTAHAVYAAWTGTPSGDPAVTAQAGYFLFVLVAGHLVYDGLALRTENLFAELGGTSIVDRDAYETFYDELTESMGDTLTVGPVTLPRSAGFALVLALGPILLPVIVTTQNAIALLAYAAYSLVTLFVVAMLYDVFVLVSSFTELVQRDILTYRPFHPDEHGGFRDLGRFATRVNAILVVAGAYVAYRFYSEGVLNVPAEGVSSPLLAVTWGVLYLGPIAAYVVLVLFWLYHSFWRLHRKMERGRQRRMEELQRAAREGEDDPPERFADLQIDAPAWESVQGAPTWPVKRQSLFGILVVDAVPVVMTFVWVGYRSTSPMIVSRLPSVAIRSGRYSPLAISGSAWRFENDGPRILKRPGSSVPSLRM